MQKTLFERVRVDTFIALTLLSSCAARHKFTTGDSTLKIVGGTPLAPSDYPATVALMNPFTGLENCTGTFIAANVILTATHCVIHDTDILTYNGEAPNLIVTSSLYKHVGDDYYDLALLRFNHPLAPKVAELDLTSSPTPIDKVTMVGFGCTTTYSSNEGRGEKRGVTLSNVAIAQDPSAEAAVIVSNSDTESGQPAGGCPGDSGGPLYLNGKVVGVASSDDSGFRNQHAKLSTKFARGFFAQAAALGFDIPGIEADSASDKIKATSHLAKKIPEGAIFEALLRVDPAHQVMVRFKFQGNQAVETRRAADEPLAAADSTPYQVVQIGDVVGLVYDGASVTYRFRLKDGKLIGNLSGNELEFSQVATDR